MLNFIGSRRILHAELRLDFWVLDYDVNGGLDAPDWVPSGGVTAAFGSALDEINVIAAVPRGHSNWSYPVLRDSAPLEPLQSVKTETKGGKRKNSGRKPLDIDGTIVTSVRLTAKQKSTLDMLGGGSWLRQQLDLFIA